MIRRLLEWWRHRGPWTIVAPDPDDMIVRAVVPNRDLIEHDALSEDCVCGPRLNIVQREDDCDGWVIVHEALDGRE